MSVAKQHNTWKYPFDIPPELQQLLRLVVAKNNITIQDAIASGLKHTLTQYHANGTKRGNKNRKAKAKPNKKKSGDS